MFKQLKTALFWYYLYKFRKRILLISLLLIIAIFSNSIYGDVVEYLKIIDAVDYLGMILISKWVIILFCIVFSIYLILTIFHKNENEQIDKKDCDDNFIKKEEKFSPKEREFLNKKKLRTKADFLIDK